jgi:hypothetical protein
MAISIALFGMSVGAVVVQVFPTYFTAARTREHLALSAFAFSVGIALSFLTHLSIPFWPRLNVASLFAVALTFVVLALLLYADRDGAPIFGRFGGAG